MIFNSLDFLFFFPIVYALYLSSKKRGQNFILLIGSYFFYGYWDYRYLSLLFLSTIIDYYASVKIEENANNPTKKKLFVTLSIVSNLGILGVFKYYNFFATSLAVLLESFGMKANPALLQIALPLGISFYTFQTMSYTIDVYRGDLKPERNFLDFALYVTYFPQLVAGPIERATRLLPQIVSERIITFENLQKGAFLILFGFYKKVYVADNLSFIVDPVFDLSSKDSGMSVVIALAAFYFQIYCDFSGYSDIARGISKFMGIELMRNFNIPLFSVNIIDLWKRWHISLTTWFRDYIYHPLGGNKVSPTKQHINNIIVFTISGLWHGANWTFIIWGIYNGILTSLYRVLKPYFPKLPGDNIKSIRILKFSISVFITYSSFAFTSILFRAQNIGHSYNLFLRMINDIGTYDEKQIAKFIKIIGILVLIEFHQFKNDDEYSIFKLNPILRVLIYLVLFYSIIILGNFNKAEFIYFVF